MARVRCPLGGGAHLFERCACDDSTCRRWVCVVCEHIIDRARRPGREENP